MISQKGLDVVLAEQAIVALTNERITLAEEIHRHNQAIKRAQQRMTALTASLCAIQLSLGNMQ